MLPLQYSAVGMARFELAGGLPYGPHSVDRRLSAVSSVYFRFAKNPQFYLSVELASQASNLLPTGPEPVARPHVLYALYA